MTDEKEKINLSALFRIGYGLYVLTTNDGRKDNGCIVNSVMQVTSNPLRVAVCVNKQNYSCGTILETLKMNVNCLSGEGTFDVFKRFGFQSGRTVDKFFGETPKRSENGLVVMPKCCNAFISLAAEQIIDLGTHDMFVCSVEEAAVFSDLDTLTYTEYQKNVKPKPVAPKKKSYVCKVCGYVFEGEELPPDFICPICKHDASAFELMK